MNKKSIPTLVLVLIFLHNSFHIINMDAVYLEHGYG